MQTKIILDYKVRIAGKLYPIKITLVTSILYPILVIKILHLYFISSKIN
jgi:hypothetical protein